MTEAHHFYLPEAEASTLGIMAMFPEQSLPWVSANLQPDDFGIAKNLTCFRRMLVMAAHQEPINFTTICTALREAGELDVCPPSFVSSLFVDANTPRSLPGFASQLREKRALRTLWKNIGQVHQQIQQAGVTVSEVLETLTTATEDAARGRSGPALAPKMKDLVMATVERLQKRRDGDVSEVGIPTGLTVLDKETGGLRPSSTWVVAGEAKGGKSTLALNFLEALAVHRGKLCLFFGLEMPAIENVERLFSSNGNILASSIRDGSLADADFTKIAAVSERLAKAPIMFREDVFDLTEMIAVAKQAKLAHPELYAVFVDYAQLVGDERDKREVREQEVARVSTALRRLAMQEKLCVIVLSQLNDEGRLRESRKLGMDATVVVIIEDDKESEHVKRIRLIQRSGRKTIIRLAYRGNFLRFDNLAEGSHYAEDDRPKKSTSKPWKQRHE